MFKNQCNLASPRAGNQGLFRRDSLTSGITIHLTGFPDVGAPGTDNGNGWVLFVVGGDSDVAVGSSNSTCGGIWEKKQDKREEGETKL